MSCRLRSSLGSLVVHGLESIFTNSEKKNKKNKNIVNVLIFDVLSYWIKKNFWSKIMPENPPDIFKPTRKGYPHLESSDRVLKVRMKVWIVTIQMKATEQYFSVVMLIMLFKVSVSSDETLKCDHSRSFKWKLMGRTFSCGAVYMLYKVVLTFESKTKALSVVNSSKKKRSVV